MKKISVLLILVIIAIAFTACNTNYEASKLPQNDQTSESDSETSDNTIKYTSISTIEELKNISLNESCVLLNDIDMGGIEWTPIGTLYGDCFSGTFDGNGYTISNFKISGDVEYAGLFGYNKGNIKNLKLANVVISTHAPENSYTGCLIGYNDQGVIENCSAEGSIVTCADEGHNYSGGLIGYNYAFCEKESVTNCHANVYIDANAKAASTSSGSNVGGLIGASSGIVAWCSASGNVTGSSYNTGNYSNDTSVGGLIGFNVIGTVKNSYAIGNVTGSGNSGGLIGLNQGTVVNCYGKGDVVGGDAGGLIGRSNGSTVNSYATGKVIADSHGGNGINYISISNAGGLIGTVSNILGNYVTINCYATGNVINNAMDTIQCTGGLFGSIGEGGIVESCYATGNVTSDCTGTVHDSYIGHIVGNVDDIDFDYATLEKMYYSEGQIISTKVGENIHNQVTNNIGTSETVKNLKSKDWFQQNFSSAKEIRIWDFSKGYPTLDYEYISNYSQDKGVIISTKEELIALQDQVLILNYSLVNDISLEGIQWSPIWFFGSSFEGNGYAISNFKITEKSCFVGLFAYNSGIIKKLGVENFEINTQIESSFGYAGGLVGSNDFGMLEQCYGNGTVTFASNFDCYVGGLVGRNTGIVTNSYAAVNVSGSTTDWHRTNFNYVGGLIGCSSGIVSYCYSTGDVFSNSADVAGYVGGLVGCVENASVGYNNTFYSSIVDCFATGNVSCSFDRQDALIGGLVGDNQFWVKLINCYRCNDQIFTVNNEHETIYEATNFEGVAKDMSIVKSIGFYEEELNWDLTVWELVAGGFPKLK